MLLKCVLAFLMDDVVGVLKDHWVEGLLSLPYIDDAVFKTNSDDEGLGPPQSRG